MNNFNLESEPDSSDPSSSSSLSSFSSGSDLVGTSTTDSSVFFCFRLSSEKRSNKNSDEKSLFNNENIPQEINQSNFNVFTSMNKIENLFCFENVLVFCALVPLLLEPDVGLLVVDDERRRLWIATAADLASGYCDVVQLRDYPSIKELLNFNKFL